MRMAVISVLCFTVKCEFGESGEQQKYWLRLCAEGSTLSLERRIFCQCPAALHFDFRSESFSAFCFGVWMEGKQIGQRSEWIRFVVSDPISQQKRPPPAARAREREREFGLRTEMKFLCSLRTWRLSTPPPPPTNQPTDCRFIQMQLLRYSGRRIALPSFLPPFFSIKPSLAWAGRGSNKMLNKFQGQNSTEREVKRL